MPLCLPPPGSVSAIRCSRSDTEGEKGKGSCPQVLLSAMGTKVRCFSPVGQGQSRHDKFRLATGRSDRQCPVEGALVGWDLVEWTPGRVLQSCEALAWDLEVPS